jgi:hypothetical protein
LNNPRRVAVNLADKVYIADTNNHRIRTVSSSDLTGIINTIAGNSFAGYNGDGLQATSTSLNFPAGVFVDQTNRAFIADTNSQIIRIIATNGIVTIVAGSIVFVPPSVEPAPGFSGNGGAATSARMSFPEAVFVDVSGRIFIAHTANDQIRVVYQLYVYI